MSAHASALIAQLQGCAAYLESQQTLLGIDLREAAMASMSKSLQAQMAALPTLGMAEAAAINDSIRASPFPEAVKSALAAAVAHRCLAVGAVETPATRKAPQTLTEPAAFLTASDMEVMNGGGPLAHKVGRLVDRLMLLGLTNPAETTIKHCSALLAAR